MTKLQPDRQRLDSMTKLHPDLKRHVTMALLSSATLLAVGAIMVATAVGIPGGSGISKAVLICAGAIFIGIGYTGASTTSKWYLEASGVVAHGSPIRARVTLHVEYSSDSTTLNARMESLEPDHPIPPDEISLLIPRWDFDSYLASPLEVSVFLNPSTSRVSAIQTPRGLLWALPNWRWPRKIAPGDNLPSVR